MIRTLGADSVRWRVGDLCGVHREHGLHGEQVRGSGDGQRSSYVSTITHWGCRGCE